jgi:hypothetical protein
VPARIAVAGAIRCQDRRVRRDAHHVELLDAREALELWRALHAALGERDPGTRHRKERTAQNARLPQRKKECGTRCLRLRSVGRGKLRQLGNRRPRRPAVLHDVARPGISPVGSRARRLLPERTRAVLGGTDVAKRQKSRADTIRKVGPGGGIVHRVPQLALCPCAQLCALGRCSGRRQGGEALQGLALAPILEGCPG